MNIKFICSLTAAVIITACGGDGGSVSKADLVKACNDVVDWGESRCECMADKAKADLSADGQRLLYASMTGDQESAERLARAMNIEEASQAGMFMLNASMACALSEPE